MTDIDFDELDQAVNSVMTDKPIKSESDRPLPQLSAAPRTSASQRPKSSGRFMDIKAPSSTKTSVPAKPKEPEQLATSEKTSTDMPDPLALHEEKMSSEKPEPKLDEKQQLETKPEVESGSPFLPDTKVEKRPLGAFSAKEDNPMDMKLPILSGQKEQAYEPPTDSELPEELQGDVLKVEGDSTLKEAVREVHTPVPVSSAVSADSSKPAPTPVFDTKDYHAALKHAQKKKSGWLTVIWIVLVILVGAGVGAAVYYFIIKP